MGSDKTNTSFTKQSDHELHTFTNRLVQFGFKLNMRDVWTQTTQETSDLPRGITNNQWTSGIFEKTSKFGNVEV